MKKGDSVMSKSPSITRTATDALRAKHSALRAGGYRPVGSQPEMYDNLLGWVLGGAISREDLQKRSQSPLVNAAYAARIASMTHAVESFLSHHDAGGYPLQIVTLGCGLDILGLWALYHDEKRIRLFELDVPEIVSAKRKILAQHGWWQVTSPCGKFVEGKTRLKEEICPEISNYVLSSCDLRDVESVDIALSKMDKSVPTLFLSELVLAYLGRQGIDDLLAWCASKACIAQGSVLVAYETLGASDCDSVVDNYRRQYCECFRDKLQRGEAQTTESRREEVFCPLGTSPGAVEKRAQKAGFSLACAALAGTVAASVFSACNGGRSFVPSEPFDEHGALALHLSSYVMLCAFPNDTGIRLIRSMCPWSRASISDVEPALVEVANNTKVTITPIEAADQPQVRKLFLQTYSDASEKHPAIRKMVKTALNIDLSFACHEETKSSLIGVRYQTWGGVFLVAADEQDTSENLTGSGYVSSRLVLGCLGIRLCEAKEGAVRGHSNTYEIHHLAVRMDARGRGIGKSLLTTAETFVHKELKEKTPYRLVATTPAVLQAANRLYSSCGFRLEREDTIGNMKMNAHVKEGTT